MIARRWRGWAASEADADAYEAYFHGTVLPQLEALDGFDGSSLERVAGDPIELVVVTRWASMDAIAAFAGEDAEAAVVEEPARAVLSGFDERVRHIELRESQRFADLEPMDLPAEAAAHEPWFNETLTTVNDAVVRMGVIEGDFHWHKHDDEDEFFLVLEGELEIDIQDADTVVLAPHHALTVPRGVVHRTRSRGRCVILMVEAAGVMPVGD